MTRTAAGALLAAVVVSGSGCRGDFQAEQGTSGSTANDGSAEDGTASNSVSGSSHGTTGDGSSDSGSSGGDAGSTDSSTSSQTGEPPCTVDSCPDDEFCVEGECGPEPPDGMIVVPAGTFYRGCRADDIECWDDELPADPDLFVSTFAIDRMAVTTSDYEACVDAGGCTPAGIEWAACNWGRPDHGNHPINCVTWFQADAYCAWAGKRLLTEAEYEKAARGTDGRLYPWGDDSPTCELTVMDIDGDGCGTGETWAVGSKPAGASPYGVLDAAGNTDTWISDWYASELEVDVDDPTGPESGDEKVLKGSSFMTIAFRNIRVSNRLHADPDEAAMPRGIRCAAG